MDTPVVTLMTLGLEERSRQILANAFAKHANGLCQLGEARQAQVALLDMDHSSANTLLSEFYHCYPGIPVIGLTTQSNELPVQAYVMKPIDLNNLLAVIIQLADTKSNPVKNMITDDKIAKAMQALENKSIAKSLHKRAEQHQTASPAKRAMPGKIDEMCFDPDRFILGAILNAIKHTANTHQLVVISCWNDHSIVIYPTENWIKTDLSDNKIRTLAIAPLDDKLASPINVEFYNDENINSTLSNLQCKQNLRQFDQEIFLWNLALMTCRGRIPAEFTVCNRYYLRRWPNLTRVNVPDNAMRILAYWSQQACSLMDIKEQLDLPLQDIFSVFSAAYAAGLSGEAKRRSDQILHALELNTHKKHGLMGAIISRLRGNKNQHFHKTA